MDGDARRQHDTVLHVDGAVGKRGYQQLVPAGPEQKYLILQWQRRKMRDVLSPCYQLEQLFVRGVANVRHCILCITRDAELIEGAFRGTATDTIPRKRFTAGYTYAEETEHRSCRASIRRTVCQTTHL